MSKQTTAPSEPIRDARKLGTGKMLILGIQHMFAMFGATILVPIITGLSVQVTLICAGLGTLFFHLCTKFKVPAFLGSSFAFLGGFAAVKLLDTGVYANLTEAEKLPYACGGIVVAGLLYLIMAAVVKFVGIKRVMRFLPPVVTGPIIILIGLILAPNAVTNASGKLVAGRPCGGGGYHRLQYVGKRHDQNHPDFDGCVDSLYCRAVLRYDRFFRRGAGGYCGPAPVPDGEV